MRFLIFIILLFALSFAQELPEEQKSEADKRAELLGTVQVSRVHPLDAAKGRYKSPRRAMFMSLLVPGSGQFYVGGKSRYIRGSFYLAEELALITGLYYHSVYKYDKQVKKYQNFADLYFDARKYDSTMYAIRPHENTNDFQDKYDSERKDYCKAIYGPALGSNEGCFNFEKDSWGFHREYYPKVKQFDDLSAFYRVIASEKFIIGWKDTEIDNIEISKIQNGDFTPLEEIESKQYDEYLSMRKKAANLADRQVIFIGAIILNHVVSAIDAALSAKAHNNSLYEEKVSFLDRIRLGSDLQLGENFRTGAAVVYLF